MHPNPETAGFFRLPPRPVLPGPLTLPLRLIPTEIHSLLLVTLLNGLLNDWISQSVDLEFLRDRVLALRIRDLRVEYRFRHTGSAGFAPCPVTATPELTISGALYDFLALATRREDSDTLFFNRHVVMEGDTALGLELKNVLDGMDPETLARPLPQILQAANRLMAAYEQLSGRPG